MVRDDNIIALIIHSAKLVMTVGVENMARVKPKSMKIEN